MCTSNKIYNGIISIVLGVCYFLYDQNPLKAVLLAAAHSLICYFFFSQVVKAIPVEFFSGFKTISKILDSLKEEVGENIVDNHNNFCDLGLLHIYHKELSTEQKEFGIQEIPTAEAKKYCKFAAAAYGFEMNALLRGLSFKDIMAEAFDDIENDLGTIMRMTGLKQENVVMMEFDSKVERPCYFVAQEDREFIITIRGTASVEDCITDLIACSSDFMDGKAHGGILSGAQAVFNETLETVIETVDTEKIVIAGHSLGGGTATLLALLYSNYVKENNLNIPVHCYAYAPPPVFNQSLPSDLHQNFHTYINYTDCVPRLSIYSVYELFWQLGCIDRLPYSDSERLGIIWKYLRGKDVSEFLEKAKPMFKEEHENPYDQMQLVGHIHFLETDSCVKYKKSFFDYVWVHPSMLPSHIITEYEEVFSKAGNKTMRA